jgi:ubiquinone/menaquinone biosynthesis C-methylase UbiE
MAVSSLMKKLKYWKPEGPVSRGADSYHKAVVNAKYYVKNLSELVSIIRNNIHSNDTIVDFGAGTGVSSLYLIKNLKVRFKLWLVDNSPAWLGKAYDILKKKHNVSYFLIEKEKGRYATLSEIVGRNSVNHVVSANTVHLIPDIQPVFKGIYSSLKPKGTFTFQSGNIMREGREEGVLMVDDTVKKVHDIALDIIKTDDNFKKYREHLGERIEAEKEQRKFVFPDPRPLELYLKNLKDAGFKYIEVNYRLIKIRYADWINFLRVKRLEAGILPEIGGKDATPEEAEDRDKLIAMSSDRLFKDLEMNNPMANKIGFTTEWVYVGAVKQ